MTTIAFREGVLAADTLVSGGGVRLGYVTKVRKLGSVLAAGAGTMSFVQGFLDWFAAGMEGDPPETGGEFEGLIIHDGRVVTWNDGWDSLAAPFYAIGSGKYQALGAMAAGATAEEAVRAAILTDCYSGGPIDILTVR